ncbi:MAG TPA: HAD family phosphatase [Pseudonocardiaceae bacterium]|nr:HAD family phosphatase [Pseudonocardiaceae bacterium]
MEERAIDAVVFDFGGVLTTPIGSSTGQWLADEGIVEGSFRTTMREWLVGKAALGSPVHRLETGELAGPDFERELAARLVTSSGSPVVAAGLLTRMFAMMVPDEAMLALIRELKAAGLRVGLLSNSWSNHYPAEVLGLCDPVVISGEVGLRKPDPAIFQLLLDRLGLPARRTAFVDDVPPNVAAAAALGIHAVHHVDATTTRTALLPLVPDLPAVAPAPGNGTG